MIAVVIKPDEQTHKETFKTARGTEYTRRSQTQEDSVCVYVCPPLSLLSFLFFFFFSRLEQ